MIVAVEVLKFLCCDSAVSQDVVDDRLGALGGNFLYDLKEIFGQVGLAHS